MGSALEFLASVKEYVVTLVISVIPVLELRASIIYGWTQELPWYSVYLISVIGNMLPVPFILLFIRRIIDWMKTTKRLHKIALWLESKGEKHSDKVLRYAFFGLALFVGIPLPGTGAWTGALVAALLDMRMKKALPSIFLGVLMAGVLIMLATYGSVSFLSFLTR